MAERFELKPKDQVEKNIYASAENVQKTNVQTPKGERRSVLNWEIEVDMYTLLWIKLISNENLLDSTGNST